MKKAHDELDLEQLLRTAKAMRRKEDIIVYYEPFTHYFYLYPADVMIFDLPKAACFLCRGPAKDLCYNIEKFISDALHKMIKEAQS